MSRRRKRPVSGRYTFIGPNKQPIIILADSKSEAEDLYKVAAADIEQAMRRYDELFKTEGGNK